MIRVWQAFSESVLGWHGMKRAKESERLCCVWLGDVLHTTTTYSLNPESNVGDHPGLHDNNDPLTWTHTFAQCPLPSANHGLRKIHDSFQQSRALI